MFADSQGFDCYLGMQVWLADDENEIHILSEKNVVNLVWSTQMGTLYLHHYHY